MGKKCESLKFAAKTKLALVLAKCLEVWCERNINEDGSLKKNNYAPIYLVRGDEKMSCRRVGSTLTLFAAKASIPLPTAKTVWTMPEGVEKEEQGE